MEIMKKHHQQLSAKMNQLTSQMHQFMSGEGPPQRKGSEEGKAFRSSAYAGRKAHNRKKTAGARKGGRGARKVAKVNPIAKISSCNPPEPSLLQTEEPSTPGERLFSDPTPVNLCTFNIRSIRSYYKRSDYSRLATLQPTILGLTETQAKMEHVLKISKLHHLLRNFESAHWNQSNEKVQAGTAILSAKRPSETLWGLKDNPFYTDNDGRTITLVFLDVCIVNCYAPCKLADNANYLKALILHVAELKKGGLPVIVMGDLNCPPEGSQSYLTFPQWHDPEPDWTKNRLVFKDLMDKLDATDVGSSKNELTWYPEPTNFSQRIRRGLRIDYILVPKSFIVLWSTTHSGMLGSDHRPISAAISLRHRNWKINPLLFPRKTSYRPDTECDILADCISYLSIHGEPEEEAASNDEDESMTDCAKSDSMDWDDIDNRLHQFKNARGKHQVTIRIGVFAGGVPLIVMCDTGSTFNLMDYDFARKNVAGFVKRFKQRRVPLTLGDERLMFTYGSISDVTLCMESARNQKVYSSANFMIVKKLIELIVLGHAYFEDSHRNPNNPSADISYRKQCITLDNHRIPWTYSLPDKSKQMLKTHASVILQPLSTSAVLCKYMGQTSSDSQPWGIFEALKKQKQEPCKYCLIRSFGHMPITEQPVRVWIQNYSTEFIRLPEGHVVGLFARKNIEEFGIYTMPNAGNSIPQPASPYTRQHTTQRPTGMGDYRQTEAARESREQQINASETPSPNADDWRKDGAYAYYNTIQTHGPEHCDDPAKEEPNPAYKPLASHIREILEAQTLPDETAVPDYYNEHGNLEISKMPDYLKGLKLNTADSHATRQQLNLLIHACLVLPKGREKLFTTTNSPGSVKSHKTVVSIMDDTPWQARLIPCSPADKAEIEKLIEKYLDEGIIEPCSGPYASAVLLVRKSNGKHKITCCLNTLNQRTRKNCYPLPLITDNLDYLGNRKWISSVDACGGYLSMHIQPKDRDYFGFITHCGLYRWTRVPYGWKNAGAQFCQMLDQILVGLKYQILISYVDDILVFHGDTFKEHLQALNVMLDRLQSSGMTLNPSKCSFVKKELPYLGFVITQEGIKPDPKNIEKILKAPVTERQGVQTLIGCTIFYRRWVKWYRQLTSPLYEALKGDFSKRDKALVQKCIDTIKEKLTTEPILRHADFTKPFILKTDASGQGFGAVLMQKATNGMPHVIAYASTGLSISQKKLKGPQLEAAGACWAMNYFRQYLIGSHFTLQVDQEVMKYIKSRSEPHGTIAPFAIESQEFEYTVEHVKGKAHQLPDFLSRSGAIGCEPDDKTTEVQERNYMNMRTGLLSREDLELQQQNDEFCKAIRAKLEDGDERTHQVFKLEDSLLMFTRPPAENRPATGSRVVVPLSLRFNVMTIIHRTFSHRGLKAMLKLITRNFYWPKMKYDIAKFVRSCHLCQRRKTVRPTNAGLTGAIIADNPADMLLMDFIGGSAGGKLPKSHEGYQYLLLVMDVFSRYPFALALKEKDSLEIAHALSRDVFAIIGYPRCMHSDNEQVLLQKSLDAAFKLMGVKRTSSSVRHPQGNSPVERFMRYLNTSFTTLLTKYDQWPQVLPMILFAYRTIPHRTTGYSPAFVLFGREPKLPLAVLTKPSGPYSLETNCSDTKRYVEEQIDLLQKIFRTIRYRQDRSSHQDADRRDTNRYEVKFKPGDPVLLHEPQSVAGYTDDIRPEVPSVEARKTIPTKWKFPWTGPHRVVRQKRGAPNNYVIDHATRKRHITANVEHLVLYHPFDNIEVELPEEHALPPTKKRKVTPNTQPYKVYRGEKLDEGCLCMVRLPENGFEPLAVMSFIDESRDDTLEMQWYGNYNLKWYFDLRMRTQIWLKGWFQVNSCEFYFQDKRLHHTHMPFTNLHSEDIIRRDQILFFDFRLKNGKLPPQLAEATIEKFRTLELPHADEERNTSELPEPDTDNDGH